MVCCLCGLGCLFYYELSLAICVVVARLVSFVCADCGYCCAG